MIAARPIQLVDADYRLLVDAVTDYAISHLDPQGVVELPRFFHGHIELAH